MATPLFSLLPYSLLPTSYCPTPYFLLLPIPHIKFTCNLIGR